MDHVEAESETIDEAIEDALKTLGVERDRVTVNVIAKGKKGLLGIGTQMARVRVTVRKLPDLESERPNLHHLESKGSTSQENLFYLEKKGKETLAEIIKLMGLKASIEIKRSENSEEIFLNICGENGGLLIGRRGQTLEALQYLLSRMVSEKQETPYPILIVDTENYRERRKKTLEDMALHLGEKAKRGRESVSIDFLSARDRRIIHLALQDDPWVTTKSQGSGQYRRLIIVPEGDRKRKGKD